MKNASKLTREFRLSSLSKTGLGVDIGQQQIKVVWYERKRDNKVNLTGVSLQTNIASAELETVDQKANAIAGDAQSPDRRAQELNPFKPKKLVSGRVTWSKEQIASLCERISKVIGAPYRRSPLCINLSMTVCDFRSIYVPPGGANNHEAVARAIRESTGEKEQLSIALLDSDGAKPKCRVFSIPQATTTAVGDAFEKQGLPPSQIDGLPWCLARCIELAGADAEDDRVATVLDWSWGKPTLVAVDKGRVSYVRRFNEGGIKDVCAQAQTDFGLNDTEAARWLTLTLADQSDNELVDDTRQWIRTKRSEMLEMIREALEYVAWRAGANRVGTLWLTGGGAHLVNAHSFAEELKRDVKLWRYDDSDRSLGPEYAVAASLALQGARNAN